MGQQQQQQQPQQQQQQQQQQPLGSCPSPDIESPRDDNIEEDGSNETAKVRFSEKVSVTPIPVPFDIIITKLQYTEEGKVMVTRQREVDSPYECMKEGMVCKDGSLAEVNRWLDACLLGQPQAQKNEMKESELNRSADSGKARIEISENTAQIAMSQSTAQNEMAQSTSQIEMSQNTAQTEMAQSTAQKEMTQDTAQIEMTQNTSQIEISQNTSQIEMSQNTAQKEMTQLNEKLLRNS